jgi:CRISPR-associated protein Cas1
MSKDGLLAGKVIIAQSNYHANKSKRIEIARRIIDGASFNILKNLKYYNSRGKDTIPMIEIIEGYREKIDKTQKISELMGIEGNIRNMYYEAFNLIIDDFEFNKRTKQPPENEVNTLVSFGNMMCYAQCLRSIHQTQLNPTISFLHEPGERRYSLALDIAEIFKPILVDRLIFKVLNKKEIQKKDFDKQVGSILLKEKGKKTFIQNWENRLGETIKHRSLNRDVSYKHLIKLECYKLSKHILGIEAYKPFKVWW